MASLQENSNNSSYQDHQESLDHHDNKHLIGIGDFPESSSSGSGFGGGGGGLRGGLRGGSSSMIGVNAPATNGGVDSRIGGQKQPGMLENANNQVPGGVDRGGGQSRGERRGISSLPKDPLSFGNQRFQSSLSSVEEVFSRELLDPTLEKVDYSDDDDEKGSAKLTSTVVTPSTAGTTASRTMSVASLSVDSSFRSNKSKGSLTSLQRNSSRKLKMMGSLPRHSRRRNKKNPKEMSWLRDTLSLCSTHSDYMLKMESDDDETTGIVSGTEDDIGQTGHSSNCSSILLDPKQKPATIRENCYHARTVSSPPCLACLKEDAPAVVPTLTPLPESAPPPLKVATSTTSYGSEVSSVEGGEALLKDTSHGNEQERQAEYEEHEAPIKWVTAPIPSPDEKHVLPRPPPPPPVESPSRIPSYRWDDKRQAACQHEQPIAPRRNTPPDREEVTRPFLRSKTLPLRESEHSASVPFRRSNSSDGKGPHPVSFPRGEMGRHQAPFLPNEEKQPGAPTPQRYGREDRRRTDESPLYPRLEQESPRDRSPPGRPVPRPDDVRIPHDDAPPPQQQSLMRRPSRERSPPPPPNERMVPPRSPTRGRSPYHQPSRLDDPRDRSPPRWDQPRDRSPQRWGPPRGHSPPRLDPRYDRGPPYGPDPREWSPYGARDYDDRIMSRRPPHQEPPPRRSEFVDDYYGPPPPTYGRRDDRGMSSTGRRGDYRYSERESYRSHTTISSDGHSEVYLRSSRDDRPPVGDPYGYDRSPYYPDEDSYYPPRGGYGRGPGYPPRGYQSPDRPLDDPAYDAYPPRDRGGGRYPPHREGPGYDEDPYGRPPPPPPQEMESDPANDRRFPPSARSPQSSNKNGTSSNSKQRYQDQDMLDEKLKQNGGTLYGGAPGAGDSRDEPIAVEISPGVRVPLRRTNETMQAIAKDFYQDTTCFACSADIFCIADVSYVICPKCKVISPVSGEYFEGRKVKRFGLGLGFTCESLFKMQSEILQDRSKYGKEPKHETDEQFTYERRTPSKLSI